MKAPRRDRRSLQLVFALISITAVLLLFAALPSEWLRPEPLASPPLVVEALTMPADSRANAAPRNGRVEDDGSLTILNAPSSVGKPEPLTSERRPRRLLPQSSQPVPAALAAGIRALFRLLPPPPERSAELRIVTLERRVAQGTLVLVRGCFRFGPRGPLAVFPPGTGLALKDGYLMVGPPGLPPELSARVGEEIFWEGESAAIADARSLQRIERFCGAGPAVAVVPASATVQQARSDGFAATNFADRYGVPWPDALRSVQRCRRKMEKNLAPLPSGKPLLLIENMCGSTPPSPVANPASCPAGTGLSGGLCRTPEGYIRPIPSL